MTTIVGAGLSGLIAASMLRNKVDFIYEQKPSLPNNHEALLRFKSEAVADAVGIPFRKVKVMKSVRPTSTGNQLGDSILYSMKCTGKAEMRSVFSAKNEVEERFIAPPDFVQQLGKQLEDKICYNKTIHDAMVGENQVISTIPMPVLMKALGWSPLPDFDYVGGYVMTCELPKYVNFCGTVYLPDRSVIPYRVSVTERKLMAEISSLSFALNEQEEVDSQLIRNIIQQSLGCLGMDTTLLKEYVYKNHTFHRMQYAKILPISESVRKRFILWASEHHNVYSLGRFATWRPGLLLDDIVSDVNSIRKMIESPTESTYAQKLKG